MWIFLNDSFLSIVACRGKPATLLVRARHAGDIERAFPKATVKRTPHADYPYRTEIRRKLVAASIASMAANIDYDNFKASVTDPDRHDLYLRVWGEMLSLQRIDLRESRLARVRVDRLYSVPAATPPRRRRAAHARGR